MKVLHIIDSLQLGGKERRLVELLRGLENHNHILKDLVVMSNHIHFTNIHESSTKIHFLLRETKHDVKIFTKLYHLCKKLKPDIIHSWESMCSFYAAPIAKLLGIPFINGMITIAPSKVKRFGQSWIRSKLTFPLSKIILSNSIEGLKSFNAPKQKGYCIPNGFNFLRLDNLDTKEIVREKFHMNTANVVGMVAVFSKKKDYETYLRAAMMVLDKRDDVTFLAVGAGNNIDNYKKMVKPEYQDKIKFLGNQRDVESIINIFDVGVLTTNQGAYGEGISNSVMEYMALAKPVIATNGGGTSEIVIDGITGFLIEPHLTEMLSQKVEYLLNNKDAAATMGKVGRERILTEFGLERMTDDFIELYEKCLNGTAC